MSFLRSGVIHFTRSSQDAVDLKPAAVSAHQATVVEAYPPPISPSSSTDDHTETSAPEFHSVKSAGTVQAYETVENAPPTTEPMERPPAAGDQRPPQPPPENDHKKSPSYHGSQASTLDRDYAFHKSREWRGIVTMTLERELPPAKKMVIFNNDCPTDPGVKFVLNQQAYRNWGQVLDEWTRRVQPKFGQITRVFTPIHGREISDLHQLRDEAVYIVGGGLHARKNPRFPPARRVDSTAVRNLFKKDKAVKIVYPIEKVRKFDRNFFKFYCKKIRNQIQIENQIKMSYSNEGWYL